MTSEIRANTLKNRVGLGTVSFTNTGPVVSGIVTANSFSGPLISTSIDLNGDLDVDGHTNLDNGNVAGIVTFNSGSALHTNGGQILLFDRPDGNSNNLFFGTGGKAVAYHDGTNFSIVNNTGHSYIGVGVGSKDLYLYAQASGNVLLQQNTGVRYVKGVGSDASVQLFFNNNLRLNTTTAGVSVTGAIAASGAVSGTTGTFTGETDIQNSILRVTDGTPRIIMSVPSSGLDTRLFNDGSGNFIIGHGTNSDTPTERFRIDSAGKIGVGQAPNTAFNVKLGVFAATGNDDASDWGADGIFQLDHSGSNAVNNEVLLLGAVSGGVGQIASGFGFGRESTSNWGTYLSFKTHSTGTSNIDELIERLRITSGGDISINNPTTPPSSNGGIGKRFGIKSNANNIIIGETESASNFGLILESRVSGRSGNARSSQIGLGNGVIDFYTAAAGAGVTKKLEITSTGALQHTPASGVNYFTGTGEYVFGSATSSPPAGGYEANVQVHTSKTRASFSINAYYNNPGGPFMQFLSSRSGTVGTLGVKCLSGDTLGEIRFVGDNGTNYNTVAYAGRLSATARSTPADGGTMMAGELNFDVVDSNGGSDNNVLKLRQDQQIEMPGARKVKINGVVEYYAVATMVNNTAYTFDFTVRNEGGYGNSFYIVVGYNHFHTNAYGAQRVAIVCTRGTSLSINADISNVTHSQAGEWSFSKPDSTTLRITKSAGTYGGSGYGFIRMTGNGNTMG